MIINYASDASAAEEVVKQIGNDRCLSVKADAGSIAGIESLVKAAVDRFGRIDILIPNAGNLPMTDLEHTTEEIFDRAISVNVKGPYFLCQVSLIELYNGPPY